MNEYQVDYSLRGSIIVEALNRDYAEETVKNMDLEELFQCTELYVDNVEVSV